MAAGTRVGKQVAKERSEVAANVQADAVEVERFIQNLKKELNLTSLARNSALASLWSVQPRPSLVHARCDCE